MVYMVPLVLIVLMAWVAFLISIKEVGTRMTIGATSMLTIVAYRFIVGINLPKVSYLTKLDLLILASTLLVFLSLLLLTFDSMLASAGKLKSANRLNLWSRWGLLIFFILILLIFFVV
jgi:hypothetical protein